MAGRLYLHQYTAGRRGMNKEKRMGAAQTGKVRLSCAVCTSSGSSLYNSKMQLKAAAPEIVAMLAAICPYPFLLPYAIWRSTPGIPVHHQLKLSSN